MTQPGAARRPWRHHLRHATTTGRDVLVDATRWQRVEIDLLRLGAAGVSLALPIAVGNAAGDLGAGMVAAIGALLMAGSGHSGGLRSRLVDLANTAAAGTTGVLLGLLCNGPGLWRTIVLVATSVVAAALGGVRPSAAKAAAQFVIFMIIGATLAAGVASIWTLTGYFVAGAVLGGLMTLLAFGIAHHLLGRRAVPVEPVRRSLAADVESWRRGLTHLTGWQYTLRLGICMVVAEALMHLLRGPHSYWVLLTVAIVVQRDHRAALARTVQRGLGTAVGVVFGALVLNAIPLWVMVCTVGVVGAARVYLKSANYTAYAVVMTPLIVVLSELGRQPSPDLLRERLVDTALGCAISLLVGYVPWRRPLANPNHVRQRA